MTAGAGMSASGKIDGGPQSRSIYACAVDYVNNSQSLLLQELFRLLKFICG